MAKIEYIFQHGALSDLENIVKERVRKKLLDAYVQIEQDVITQMMNLQRRLIAHEMIELSHQFGKNANESDLIVKIITCYKSEDKKDGKEKKKTKSAKK